MVDAVSGGRLEFGIGSGNTPLDYQVFDIAREEGQERMEETLEIILKAWRSERCKHEGKFWSFQEITLYPRPVQQPHPPVWVAGTSARTLEWAGRRGYNIMTVGHPHPPEKVGPGVEAWKKALIENGIDPTERRCQFHVRTHVNENVERAREIAMAAVTRYDAISRIGRKSAMVETDNYDWDGMLATGRNLYGNPDLCIEIVHNAMRHYYFDTLTTTFNFGGIPHDEIKKSMCLFAKEIMPAFR